MIGNKYLLASNDLSFFKISKATFLIAGYEALSMWLAYITTLNLSTNLPGLSSLEALDFNYFIDIANVWGVDYSSSIDESNVVRSSTGLALDVFTPIGPLSFSFAKPITQKNTDKTETFRFQLGTTF